MCTVSEKTSCLYTLLDILGVYVSGYGSGCTAGFVRGYRSGCRGFVFEYKKEREVCVKK